MFLPMMRLRLQKVVGASMVQLVQDFSGIVTCRQCRGGPDRRVWTRHKCCIAQHRAAIVEGSIRGKQRRADLRRSSPRPMSKRQELRGSYTAIVRPTVDSDSLQIAGQPDNRARYRGLRLHLPSGARPAKAITGRSRSRIRA